MFRRRRLWGDVGTAVTSNAMSRFAFALRPKWIFGHLIVLALVVTFVNAGFWQLRRLDQRKAYNREVAANLSAPIEPVDRVLPIGSTFADVPHRLNHRVTATGHYLIDQEIVISGQASVEGVPGVWIVSPLQLADGRILLVNRGWLPSTGQITSPPANARPPSGSVKVTGLISQTQVADPGESPERDVKNQRSFLRIDVARLQRQFSSPLVPAFLQRTTQRPTDPGPQVPQPLPLPTLTNGPHLNYAMQWFSFTGIALIGYPLLLWMVARDRKRSNDRDDVPPEDLPEGAFIDDDGVVDLTGVDADRR